MALLPSGYTRLLYIESTGTQCIDTGVVAGASVGADFVIQNTGAASAGGCFMSAYGGSDTTKVTYYYATGGKVVANHGGRGYVTILAAQDTVKHTVCARPASVTVDGNKYSLSGSGGLSIPLYLFAENSSGKPVDNGSYRLYSCKLYNGTTMLRNFIPCTNDTGEVGLYDTVNGVFCGNSGTGVFVAGPEFWYDELEYIESTGTQRIDTGFYPNQDTHVAMDADVPAVTSGNFPALFFGDSAGATQTRYGTMIYGGNDGFHDHYGNQTINTSNIGVSGRHLFDKNKNVTYLDNIPVSNFSYSAFTSAVTLGLFCSYENGRYDYYATFKLYSCKVYDNDTLVRDYVPAKLPDGSIGLIDKLTGEFYPNRGTGTFIAGPVVKEEIPPRKVTVDLIPPMTGEKTDDFTIEYSVVDDVETETFEAVEYIDGAEQRSLSVAANEKVSTLIESTGMADGLHTFMLVVDGTVEVEYSFYVNNTTTRIETTELSINMPTTVNVNEKFLISVIITELSFTIAKLKIHAGDVYSGEV